MCVESGRSGLFSRASFLAAAAAAAAPLLAEPAAVQAASQSISLAIPAGLRPGNARAAGIARDSALVRTHYVSALALARSIGDARLRGNVLDVIENPVPTYARRYRTEADRTALRDQLARAGFVKSDAPVSGIFPPGTDGTRAVQPFWSAPGSAYDSHHSYPGGLLTHELFNSTMAEQFTRTYDAVYFGGRPDVSRDSVIAAAFYHDIMKTVVFQYNDDGSLTPELEIGQTGGHHCISGAEAIVRGHDARFVTILLSAHAAPSLGDEVKVVTWCRAAAMIAGVDPVEYGLVRKTPDGYALAALPPIECFVNHLSDHDYVLTVYAVQQMNARLPADRWRRHKILADKSAVALYQALANS